MLPIGPAIFIAARLLSNQKGGNQVQRRGTNLGFIALAKFIVGLIAFFPLIALTVTTAHDEPAAIAVVGAWLLSAVLLVPVPFIAWTTVRLGWPRATYYIARLTAAFSIRRHYVSGAAFLAALALKHQRVLKLADRDWVAKRIALGAHPVTNAASAMILEWLHGAMNRDSAAIDRAWGLASLVVWSWRGDAVPRARKLAMSFLMGHAYVRGNQLYAAALSFASDTFSWKAWALRVLARMQTGAEVGRFNVGVARLVIGRAHWDTLAALDAPTAEAPPAEEDPLTRAVRNHVAAVTSEPVRLGAVERAVMAWAVVDNSADARASFEARCRAVGARAANLAATVEDAYESLAEVVVKNGATVPTHIVRSASPGAESFRLRVKDLLWTDLEASAERLRALAEAADGGAKDRLDPASEWMECARCVRLWTALKAVAPAAELYAHFGYPIDKYACFTCDRRTPQQRGLAYALFGFLREQAEAAGNADAAARLGRNLDVARVG